MSALSDAQADDRTVTLRLLQPSAGRVTALHRGRATKSALDCYITADPANDIKADGNHHQRAPRARRPGAPPRAIGVDELGEQPQDPRW